MNTNLKAILVAAAIAALASPVMAQSEITRPDVAAPAAAPSKAYGAATHTRVPRTHTAPAPAQQAGVRDCIHVDFPQCGESPLAGEDR